MNLYSLSGERFNFHLMHFKIAMNIIQEGFRLVKFRIKGVRISEGQLYLLIFLWSKVAITGWFHCNMVMKHPNILNSQKAWY